MIRKGKERIISANSSDRYYGPAVIYTLFGDPALRIKYLNNPTNLKNSAKTLKRQNPVSSFGNVLKVNNSGLLTVYSLSGQVIVKEHINKKSSIELENGLYLVTFDNEKTKLSYVKNVTIMK